MPFATWWRGDPLPALPLLPAFSARSSEDVELLARLVRIPAEEIEGRLEAGNRPYLAYMGGEPAAYGWLATQRGGIEELDFSFLVPPEHGYLWDFYTLPSWRKRGVYTHLLHAIIEQEPSIKYFWIGHKSGNEVSRRGISRAGFRFISEFAFSPDGRIAGLTLFDDSERAHRCATIFGLPVVEET